MGTIRIDRMVWFGTLGVCRCTVISRNGSNGMCVGACGVLCVGAFGTFLNNC